MRKYFSYLVLVIVCQTSCFNKSGVKEPGLFGTWCLYDLSEIDASKSGDTFLKEANFKSKVKDGQLLNIFEDGTYTTLTADGIYETGKWKLTKRDSYLNLFDSKMLASGDLKIEKNEAGKPVLSLSNPASNLLTKFIKDADELKKYNEDPFYPNNNTWRIKPAAPEDPGQIRLRTSNYLKHVAMILKAAKERNLQVVSFEYSKGPIKIYNGGIGIHPYQIVPDEWKNCFYDEADASTAWQQYENYLSRSSYRGAGTGNWIEDDYDILLAIYAGLNAPVAGSK